MISVFQFRFVALSPWRTLFLFQADASSSVPRYFLACNLQKIRWSRLQVWISDLPLVQPLQPSNVTWLWRDLSISSGVHQIRLLVCHWSSALASALCIFVFGLGKSLFFHPPWACDQWSLHAPCSLNARERCCCSMLRPSSHINAWHFALWWEPREWLLGSHEQRHL